MSREKYQRPEVHAWTGKSGTKFWKAEWRVYIEGRPKPKHRVMTWPCSEYSKSKAQEACDKLVREETGGPLRADGSMTAVEFWENVFYPVRKRQLAPSSQASYASCWKTHLKPVVGSLELRHVTKHAADTVLGNMADAGRSKQTVEVALSIMKSLFDEAEENGYIVKNPIRKVQVPRCAERKSTRPMDAAEVRRLLENTVGRDNLIWRILLLTGARIGEVLALTKSDLRPEGLVIDESSFAGRPSQTKNRKPRTVPITDGLRSKIEQWVAAIEGEALFPATRSALLARNGGTVQAIIRRGRVAAKIPDLNFRMTRTTFSTLFEGDPRDLQEILGHSRVDLTMAVYKKPIAERQRVSVDRLEASFTGKVVKMPAKRRAG